MIQPKTRLVPTLPEREPALESAVEGVSVYRAARADARLLHKLLPLAEAMGRELRALKGKTPSMILNDFDNLMEGRG